MLENEAVDRSPQAGRSKPFRAATLHRGGTHLQRSIDVSAIVLRTANDALSTNDLERVHRARRFDNGKCSAAPDQAVAVTDQLAHGRPASDGSGLAPPRHAARKCKWWLLYFGLRSFSDADC